MDGLIEIIKDKNFWTGSVVGIALFKLIEKIFSDTINFLSLRAKYIFNTIKYSEIFTITNIPPKMARSIKPALIISRFGNDEFLQKTANEKEKLEMGLLNKVKYLKHEYSHEKLELTIYFKINIHKKFGTQFKMFLDFYNDKYLATVNKILEKQTDFTNISKSESYKERLYFILEKYRVVKTSEGIDNNFIYLE